MDRAHCRKRVHEIAEGPESNDEETRHSVPALRIGFQSREQLFGRMILRVAHNRDPPPVRAHDLPLGHGVDGVVRALTVDIRLQLAKQPLDGELGKEQRRSQPPGAPRRAPRALPPPAEWDVPAPFSARSDSSSLIATTSRSPSRAAPSRYLTCPTWRISKHPLAKEIRHPARTVSVRPCHRSAVQRFDENASHGVVHGELPPAFQCGDVVDVFARFAVRTVTLRKEGVRCFPSRDYQITTTNHRNCNVSCLAMASVQRQSPIITVAVPARFMTTRFRPVRRSRASQLPANVAHSLPSVRA